MWKRAGNVHGEKKAATAKNYLFENSNLKLVDTAIFFSIIKTKYLLPH